MNEMAGRFTDRLAREIGRKEWRGYSRDTKLRRCILPSSKCVFIGRHAFTYTHRCANLVTRYDCHEFRILFSFKAGKFTKISEIEYRSMRYNTRANRADELINT